MSSPIGAIVLTDLRLRWRRTSTVVTLLLMIIIAYGVVPDFRQGSTVMAIDGHRAVYNSASLSIATSLFASFFLGLFGFYLVSNALRRDLETGTGFIIAATPIRNAQYLLGKLAGNLLFLATLLVVYLAGVVVMHLLRAEAPLDLLTYLGTYALVVTPALVFASVLGLLFECLTPLSGRAGDILYFILWLVLLTLGAINADAGAFTWSSSAFDVMGMGYLLGEFHRQGFPPSMAVGHTAFDPSLAPIAIQPFAPTGVAVASRLVAVLLPLPFFFVALVAFHRFDPARVKSAARSGGRSLTGQLQRLLKPVTRLLLPIAAWGGRSRSRLLGQVVTDAAMTLMNSPASTVALIGLNIASALVTIERFRAGILPATFVCLILALAELPTRDRAAGTLPMLDGMPGLKARRVLWKSGTAMLLALSFLAGALVRCAFISPATALALAVGGLFTSALAIFLGLLTGTPKAFAALFLFFIYLVLNGRQLPALDFAGWNGVATSGSVLGYAVAAVVLTAGSMTWQRVRGV